MVRVGLIGCGRIGQLHKRCIERSPLFDLVGVCDPHLYVAKKYVDGVAVLSLSKLLQQEKLQAVVVAAPTPDHYKIVKYALANGKHVFCEKPLSFSVKQDRELQVLAESQQCILQVGFWRRHCQSFIDLLSYVEKGAIGELRYIRCAQWDAKPPSIQFCKPSISGGLEVDCGVHEFDFVHWLTGHEPKVELSVVPPPSNLMCEVGDVDTVLILATLSSGVAVSIDLTRRGGGKDLIRTELIGETGSIVVEITDQREFAVLNTAAGTHHFGRSKCEPINEAFARELDIFAQRILGGSGFAHDAAGAKESSVALQAARYAQKTRKQLPESKADRLNI